MNSDQLTLAFIAVLAVTPLLIKAFANFMEARAKLIVAQAKTVDVNAAQDNYILQSLALLQATVHELQTEALKSAHQEGEYKLEIQRLNFMVGSKEAETLTLLKRLEPKIDTTNRQAFLANKQISDWRHEDAVNANPNDKAKTDADYKINVDEDFLAKTVEESA